jgi:branched-subunit amino acid aminotransferase/4-amino-4-deoxychorismate lyase
VSKVFRNNQLLEKKDVLVSLDDRSFRFGDGCFETIPFYSNRSFKVSEHLSRLKNGLDALSIELTIDQIPAQIKTLIDTVSYTDGFIRINCSRGSGSIGFLPTSACEPYYIIEVLERTVLIPEKMCLYLSKIPKISEQQLPIHSKLNNSLNSILARIEADKNKCFESLQFTLDGRISEGSSSNISWLKNNVLYMPSSSCDILQGITQLVLEEISTFKINRGEFILKNLVQADEIFLTNSAWEIVSVNSIHSEEWEPKTFHIELLQEKFKQYIFNNTK